MEFSSPSVMDCTWSLSAQPPVSGIPFPKMSCTKGTSFFMLRLLKLCLAPSLPRGEKKWRPETARHGPTCYRSVKKKFTQELFGSSLSHSTSTSFHHAPRLCSSLPPNCPHSKFRTSLEVPSLSSSPMPRVLPRSLFG